MKEILKYLILLACGGAIYYCIEILARGYSHWTMILVGGICFVLMGLLNEKTPKMPLVKQMLISTIMVVIIEFIAGCFLNLWLGLNIWDYADRPFNLLGQICLKNTIYWFLLSAPAIIIDDYLRHWLFRENKPQYSFFGKDGARCDRRRNRS